MGVDKVQVKHRPSALKQTNKSHKHGNHRSKGAIDAASKGKNVGVKEFSKRKKKELGRVARRNKSEQLRKIKRDEILSKKRGLGGSNYAPFLICVLPLNQDIDAASAMAILTSCDPEAIVNVSDTGVTHISMPRFKQRFSFVVPPKDNDFALLDTLKVCDTVLVLVSAVAGNDEVVDNWGSDIMQAAIAQALPTSCVALMDLESVHPKKRAEVKQAIQKNINKWLPDEKLMNLDKDVDAINILRKLGNQKQKSILYRDRRPHVYAETVEYINDNEGSMGHLKISGYLRGGSLSVNGLVHLPGLGDFQMSKIEAENSVYSFTNKKIGDNAMEVNDNVKLSRVVLNMDEKLQESLISENQPTEEEQGEQTWPTEQDYEDIAAEEKVRKRVKRVPKGWSDYQAAWIPDVDAESMSENSDESDVSDVDAMSEAGSETSTEEDDFQTIVTETEMGVNDEKYDEEMDLRAERIDLENLKQAKSDMMFPDELDTPHEIPARERFQKYRGLESFRTSPWDPKENLPSDYARIFKFENFDRTKKRIIKELDDVEGAKAGWYVTIHITGISQIAWSTYSATKGPVVLIGLLPHEHKMSVLNAFLKRTSNYEQPIKSKDRLIFQCGYRRFIVNPVFSEHTNGSKHKYQRFFQPNTAAVATFFAPIQFPPSPVLCYKEVNNKVVFVASGSLLSVNPDRMVIKRIVLSGHPFKVHKRSAVIRFMFFNREDIKYFQPCKLRTKYGRTGHIKEPLGTHGHMKCQFSGQLKSQDTILLNLYKRVFPKWTYEECTISCLDTEKMQL